MRSIRSAALALLLALLPPLSADAQEWPARPLRIIVPYPPGGGTDVVARLIARPLGTALGQPVVVENRPGAGGIIGTEAISRAAPDGYTFGIATTSTLPASVVLQRSVPYHPVRSFTPVSQLGVTRYVLLAGPAAPGTTLRDFLAAARARPGAMNHATSGAATLGNLLTRQLEAVAGVQLVQVPYRGSGPIYPDLMNGTVAVTMDNPTSSAALVNEGRLRALAVTLASPAMPGVPTFASLGLAGLDEPFWFGLIAPAGLPGPVAERVQAALARHYAADAPARAELTSKDIDPVMGTPAAFAATIAADLARLQAMADRLGITPE